MDVFNVCTKAKGIMNNIILWHAYEWFKITFLLMYEPAEGYVHWWGSERLTDAMSLNCYKTKTIGERNLR